MGAKDDTMRRAGGAAVRLLLAAILLYGFSRNVSWAEVLDAAARFGWVETLALAGWLVVPTVLFVVRWRRILSAMGEAPPFFALLRAIYVGGAYNLLLPSTVG